MLGFAYVLRLWLITRAYLSYVVVQLSAGRQKVSNKLIIIIMIIIIIIKKTHSKIQFHRNGLLATLSSYFEVRQN
jgi:hypothetical protein